MVFRRAERISQNFEEISVLATLYSPAASFFDLVSSIFGELFYDFCFHSFILFVNHRDGVEKFLRAVLPLAWEEYAVDIYLRVRRKMGLWLQGQMLLSLVVGIATL